MKVWRRKPKNVFEATAWHRGNGTDAEWFPFAAPKAASDSMPGSAEKIAEMRARLECGRELWHDDDRNCFDGGKDDD